MAVGNLCVMLAGQESGREAVVLGGEGQDVAGGAGCQGVPDWAGIHRGTSGAPRGALRYGRVPLWDREGDSLHRAGSPRTRKCDGS